MPQVAGIHYEVAGSGPPVVLVHAGVVDSRIWRTTAPLLAGRHTVVTYDQRGFGRSDAWEGPYDPVADLVAVLDDAGIRKAALVGLSRGGRIALGAALERPERVAALVLVASALGGHPLAIEGTPEQEARWAELEAAGDPAGLAEADLEVWAPLGADEELRAMFLDNAEASNADDPVAWPGEPQRERLGEVRAPTLVVTGGRDVPALEETGDVLAAGIPGARRDRIAEADHMAPWRAPEELARLVRDFLAV